MTRPVKSGFMKVDGTITVGNIFVAISAIVTVALSAGIMSGRLDKIEERAVTQRTEFSQALLDVKEGLKEQRQESKELAKAVQAITTDTALIRGRLAGNDGSNPARK